MEKRRGVRGQALDSVSKLNDLFAVHSNSEISHEKREMQNYGTQPGEYKV